MRILDLIWRDVEVLTWRAGEVLACQEEIRRPPVECQTTTVPDEPSQLQGAADVRDRRNHIVSPLLWIHPIVSWVPWDARDTVRRLRDSKRLH